MHCVAGGGASGAGTEEGTSFHVTSLVAISRPDDPLRMCDVSYHRISQHLGLAANHDHRGLRRSRGRPEFGQHREAELL